MCLMDLMHADPLLGQVGGGWALKIKSFLGPKWHLPNGLMPFHISNKVSISRAQPLPTCPCIMDLFAANTLHMVPNKSLVHK